MKNNIYDLTSVLKTLASSNPVEAFLEDTLSRAEIDVIPGVLLHSMYKGWGKKQLHIMLVKNSVKIKHFIGELEYFSLHRNYFYDEVRHLMDSTPDKYPRWNHTGKNRAGKETGIRITKGMNISAAEPLLDEFDCTDWMEDPTTDRVHLKMKHRTMRGLYRK